MVAAAFDCPKCGASLTLRAPGASLCIVCEHCGSILDAQDPKHKRLSEYTKLMAEPKPLLPIGKRGKIRGEDFEIIGALRRKAVYYGVEYPWTEYLLYNPYKGFRWLLESNGHWTYLKAIPNPPGGGRS